MPDLSSWTSLPNLHPALVHFPLALLPTAILFDVLGLCMRRQEWLERSAAALYGGAALGALLAQWAGQRAADSLVWIPAMIEPRIAEHSDWAHYATWSMGALAALRLSAALWDRESARVALRALLLVAALATLGLLGYAADLGGALVYRHAVAVEAPAPEETAPPPRSQATRDVGPAASRLGRLDTGTLRWDPLPVDLDALGEILIPAPGFSTEPVSVVASAEDAGAGLTLAVEGTTLLLLPGTFGDVRVEANLELIDFQGTLGVAHHVGDDGTRGIATLSTSGQATLADQRGGELKSLDEGTAEAPEGVFTLAVSSSGRHLKGLLDGKTVTHGHVAPGPEGGCGLYLDGKGSLRVISLSVTPLEGH